MLRKWATPLTIASFIIVGVTGVLWYFHLVTGIARWMHEIIGLAMVVIVGLHLALNWRPFKIYLKKPIGLTVILLGVALTIGAYVWPEEERAGRGGPPSLAAISAFSDETLTTLGPIFDTTGDVLVTRLESAGFEGVTASSTVEDLVGTNERAQLSAFTALAR